MQQLALELAPPPPSLANFVAGRNAPALGTVRDLVGASPAERFVYLWGVPGSGRTHLLRAAAAAATHAGLASRYVAGNSLSDGSLPSAGLVAVDDVECLDTAQQIALFDLYNRILAAGGRLLVAGARAPRELALREDLRTRLGAGVTFELHPLSDEEKAAALRGDAAERGLRLDDGVIAYLLSHVARDMATLVAVLDALDRASLAQKRALTVPFVRETLAATTATAQETRRDAKG
jgi:DnaA family protein